MKTLDEVIDALERCSKPHYFDCNGCPYEDAEAETGCHPDDRDADVLHYLKEYRSDRIQWEADRKNWQDQYAQAVENFKSSTAKHLEALKEIKGINDPLTWEQLKQMEGKPVWLEYGCDFNQKRWTIITSFHGGKNEFQNMNVSGIYPNTFWQKDMGKDEFWQAYRKERS